MALRGHRSFPIWSRGLDNTEIRKELNRGGIYREMEMLGISCRKHRTNESVLNKLITEKTNGKVALLKLRYFGHMAPGNDGQLALERTLRQVQKTVGG